MVVVRPPPTTWLILLGLIVWAAFFGGVEDGRTADTREEYLEVRSETIEEWENTSAEPETERSLSETGYLGRVIMGLIERSFVVGREAALAGVAWGYRFPVLAWHLVWLPPIVLTYASPWLVLLWHKSQVRAAQQAAANQ